MRTFTLFYSWQSDRASDLCRNFINEALKLAAEKIRESREIIVVIDADTQGVSGTPPISETILKKIDTCDAFMADLTLVAATPAGKASPNPNVLIEYGFALKAKGSGHLILAMNTAFGGPSALPFDLRHLRHPLQYQVDEDMAPGERRQLRSQFADRLVVALNAVIDQPPVRKKGGGKGVDPRAQAAKRLAEIKIGRGRTLSDTVQAVRVLLDIVPLAALAERRLDLSAVKAARPWFAPDDDCPTRTSTKHGQWISIDPPEHENWPGPLSRWSTRLIAPGFLERAFSIGEYDDWRTNETIDGPAFDQQLLSAIRRSGELFAAVGLAGPALVNLSIEDGKDLQLFTSKGAGSFLGNAQVAFDTIEIADLRTPLPAEVRPILDDLWQACGWEDGTPSIDANGWVAAAVETEGAAA